MSYFYVNLSVHYIYVMAKFQPTLIGESLFGKVGGQNVSLTRNGSIIRNTTIPPLSPTLKQSKQRFKTAGFGNSYKFLSAAQKTAWESTAVNYTYIDSAGDVITRNGYETYQFCNQNLEVINLPPLASPATYAAIDIPDITIETSNEAVFAIKGTNLNSDYTYALFAQLHSSIGASSLTPKPLLVGLITYADLLAGVDVVPYFTGVLEIPAQTYRAAIFVSAIDQVTGNRDINGVKLDANVNPSGLGLDILSYYPFTSDANDYFGNNDPDYANVTFDNNGIVDGRAIFSGTSSNYISFPSTNTFDFSNGVDVMPYSICFWYNLSTLRSLQSFISRFGSSSGFASYYIFARSNDEHNYQSFDSVITSRYRSMQDLSINTGVWYFVTMLYKSDGTTELYLNNVLNNTHDTSGAYVNQVIGNQVLYLGKHAFNSTYFLEGSIAELTFISQLLTPSEITAIYNANLAGQTIIDIN